MADQKKFRSYATTEKNNIHWRKSLKLHVVLKYLSLGWLSGWK